MKAKIEKKIDWKREYRIQAEEWTKMNRLCKRLLVEKGTALKLFHDICGSGIFLHAGTTSIKRVNRIVELLSK